ncbi:S8/S53 family peptidase [Kiritimatiellaeota bacterium B1221]|nr:S8/S53 family peptidase [Kiritimatiellaeota bacterium B1221]
MKTVLICDNQGMMPSRHLRNEYPNASFEVLQEAKTLDPHGEMVAEAFLKGHGKQDEVRIIFYPYIQLQKQNPYDWADAIEAVDPDLCNCSFGTWDKDDEFNASMQEMMWTQSSKAKQIPRQLGSSNVFFASGNFNSKWDIDDDIAWPQKALQHLPNIYLIGSANRNGFPAASSSDGSRIFCMGWGRDIRLWHPGYHSFVIVSGTSFASPFVCGIMARDFSGYRFSQQEAHTWLVDRVTVAEGWRKGDRHPVAGFGDITTYWERTK